MIFGDSFPLCRGSMGFIYEKVLRPALFKMDSEPAHELGVEALALLGRVTPVCRVMEACTQLPASHYRPVEAFGLKFPNAVGLAAGFDKNARAWEAAACSTSRCRARPPTGRSRCSARRAA